MTRGPIRPRERIAAPRPTVRAMPDRGGWAFRPSTGPGGHQGRGPREGHHRLPPLQGRSQGRETKRPQRSRAEVARPGAARDWPAPRWAVGAWARRRGPRQGVERDRPSAWAPAAGQGAQARAGGHGSRWATCCRGTGPQAATRQEALRPGCRKGWMQPEERPRKTRAEGEAHRGPDTVPDRGPRPHPIRSCRYRAGRLYPAPAQDREGRGKGPPESPQAHRQGSRANRIWHLEPEGRDGRTGLQKGQSWAAPVSLDAGWYRAEALTISLRPSASLSENP